MTAQVTPPRRPSPRQPSHWARNVWIGIIGVFVILAVLGSAASRPMGNTGPTAPPDALASDLGSYNPDATEEPSPTAGGATLLTFKGTGPQTSDPFSASGDIVEVKYDFTCPAEDTFTINFYGAGASPVLPDVLTSEYGATGSNAVTENLNGATGPFTVEVDSPCSWTVEVMGTP